LIVLSPDGYEPESSIGQGITAAMERGVPLLGVVRERWTPAAAPAPDRRSVAPPPGRISASVRRPSSRLARPVVVAVTLAAGAAGSWALLAAEPSSAGHPLPPRGAHACTTGGGRAGPIRVDSLAWTCSSPRTGDSIRRSPSRPPGGGRRHAVRHPGRAG